MSARLRNYFWVLFIVTGIMSITSQIAHTQEQPNIYEEGKLCYHKVLSYGEKATKSQWEECAKLFNQALQSNKFLPDKCHYYLGQIYHHCFDITKDKDDFLKALFHYRTLTERLSHSYLADDAQYLIGIMYSAVDLERAYEEFKKVEDMFPRGDMVPEALKKAEALREQSTLSHSEKGQTENIPQQSILNEISYWSGKEYTRVVLYTASAVAFEVHRLPKDNKGLKPPRIFLDLSSCRISKHLNNSIPIKDGLLQQIRASQFNPTTTRVVLDLHSMRQSRVFTMENPFRIVIDVFGNSSLALEKKEEISPSLPVIESLPNQLGLTVRTVVIDPGHGGKDKGAIGPNGLYEKDVTLAIAKELKNRLENTTHCKVYLTRLTDKFLSLEERTAIANAKKADLFISIHTNAHKDPKIGGVETYFLNFSADQEAARVAALENAISSHKLSDLEAILKDLLFITKVHESLQLAQIIHKNLVNRLRNKNILSKDLGVKQAPFYVLLGANMPAVLVEVAFISNPNEEKLLRSKTHISSIADGIALGITDYAQTIAGIVKARDE